jgi:hypothetical protein
MHVFHWKHVSVSLREKNLRDRLAAAKPHIMAAETEYRNRGANGAFYTIAATTTVGEFV